jgi:hypothetical protein
MLQLSVVASISLGAAQMAFAQGVGNLGSLPTQFTTPNPPTGWNVMNSTPWIPVVLDPTGPVWGKNFGGSNPDGSFTYPAGAPPLPVQELLQVDPASPPWTDWHEDVLDPAWSWANPFVLVNGNVPPGLTITGVGTGSLSFFFNSVAPGSTIDIRKDLVWNGVPGTSFTGVLPIHEYPTPEPASIGLLCVGGLLALRRLR